MRPGDREWTYNDLDILRREFPKRPTSEVARMLRRTEYAVINKAGKEGLRKEHHGIRWTPEMLKTLRAYYPTMFNDAAAKLIGVSVRSMLRKARELGLYKSENFRELRAKDIQDAASAALRRAYREGRLKSTFKPGIRSNPEGEFKPGHMESQEIKEKRSAALRRTFAKKKLLKKYGLL